MEDVDQLDELRFKSSTRGETKVNPTKETDLFR